MDNTANRQTLDMKMNDRHAHSSTRNERELRNTRICRQQVCADVIFSNENN